MKHRKHITLILLVFLICSCARDRSVEAIRILDKYMSRGLPADYNYVDNEATAASIACAVWEPIFGARKIAAAAPYQTRLEGDVWEVMSRVKDGLQCVARISKKDRKILYLGYISSGESHKLFDCFCRTTVK